MANQEHIQWLLEGVEAWNNRRERDEFSPDLEKEEFGMGGFAESDARSEIQKRYLGRDDRVNLPGIDLSGANLRKAILNNVNLSNANLRCADLKGSELNGVILEDADLDFADLRGSKCDGYADFKRAKLHSAQLEGADFTGANLQDAHLAEAKLCGADLCYANLVGANLFRTRLWTADLFSGPQHSESKCRNIISSVNCLLDTCREVGEQHENGDVLLYFRGECCDKWKLCPSVMRDENLRKAEGEMLVDLISRRPEEFDAAQSALAQWVLAQHHRLKTRLLDVTRNPLVALFHACETNAKEGLVHVFAVSKDLVRPFNSDTVSIIVNFAKLPFRDQQLLLTCDSEYGDVGSAAEFPRAMDRLYSLIRQEKPHFQEKIDPRDLFRVFIVEPKQAFERVRAQSGAFLLSAFHKRFEPDTIADLNSGVQSYDHYLLKVPHANKQRIMEELNLLNVTRETLFPGVDEAAKVVLRRYSGPQDEEHPRELRTS